MDPSFFIRLNRKYVKVCFDDILYVEDCKTYLQLVTQQQPYLVPMQLTELEELLPPGKFVRVHQSYIIALQHITAFDQYSVYFGKQHSVPVGEPYRKVLPGKVKVIYSDVRRAPGGHSSPPPQNPPGDVE